MRQGGLAATPANVPHTAPFLVRLVSKLVLEVLPASLASIIGAFLFAHYQFSHPAGTGSAAVAPAAPASAEMIRLVHDEHDLISQFLTAQQKAEKTRYAAADAGPAPAADAAKLAAAAAARDAATAMAQTPAAAGTKPIVVATAAPPVARAAPATVTPTTVTPTTVTPTLVIAAAPLATPVPQDDAIPVPAPRRVSLIARTLAVKDHVVSATLHATFHAVSAIGGIPSWIGHRFGGSDDDPGGRSFSAS